MMKTFSTITFLMCLIFVSFSCDRQGKNTEKGNVDFRLITYNVWYGFTKDPGRKVSWIQWMRDQKPDVVSLQELNDYTPNQLTEDAAEWGHPYSVLLKEEGFPTGVTSKYPIEDIHRFMEGFHHGLLRVKIQGKYIYIIHLHPSNWEIRNREIDFIISNINTLPPDSPVILAGDFNTLSPFDSTYYTHSGLEPFFQARDKQFNEVNLRNGKLDYSVIQKLIDFGLTDVEYSMRTKDYHFTGSFPTLIEKEGDDGDQRRLDYVFVNKSLAGKVVKAEIVADSITLKLSDHLPLVVDFKLE
jgi:endonuclease/exonuclease/phosphatase family metal-dependent hydrolase